MFSWSILLSFCYNSSTPFLGISCCCIRWVKRFHILFFRKIQAWTGLEPMTYANTGAVLYQLSYRVTWELVTLWVRNIPRTLTLSKRQSPITVLFWTTLNRTITLYELLILLGSNHLQWYHNDRIMINNRFTIKIRLNLAKWLESICYFHHMH